MKLATDNLARCIKTLESSTHDYGIGFARDTLTLLPHFLEDVRDLEKTLREKLGNA
jgi:hypothetical protein